MFFKKKAARDADTLEGANKGRKPDPEGEEALILRARDAIIKQAIDQNADAIIIQPTVDEARIQFRIGNTWADALCIPNHVYRELVASLKPAAQLPRTRSSWFELGLILFEHDGKEYEAYVSFLPTRAGDRVAMRLIAESGSPHGLTPYELLHL